jgi:hypothetical protein
VKAKALPKFETGLGRDRGIETSHGRVEQEFGRTHQREHQSAISDIVTRQPAVQQRNTATTVTVVDPVLGRIFDSCLALNRPEGNFVELFAI